MLTKLSVKKRHADITLLVAAAMMLFSTESRADSGFYIGGSVGQVGVEIVDDTIVPPINFDEDDFAWKALAGYNFQFTVVELGIELNYVNLGAPSAPVAIPGPPPVIGQLEVETTGIGGYGVLGIALGPIGVFGKYGVISWDAEGTVSNLPVFDDDGSDPAYGVGVKFGIGSLDIRVEYDLYDIDEAEDVTMISAGLVWTF